MIAKRPLVIVWKGEGLLKSIMSDTYTFGVLLASLWFNHHFLAANPVVTILIVTAWLVFTFCVGSVMSLSYYTKDDAIKAIEDLAEDGS